MGTFVFAPSSGAIEVQEAVFAAASRIQAKFEGRLPRELEVVLRYYASVQTEAMQAGRHVLVMARVFGAGEEQGR